MEDNLFGRVRGIVNRHTPKPGEPDFRGWEWRYAWAQSQSDALYTWDTPEEMVEIAAVRISSDQRYLVSSEYYPQFWGGGVIRRLWCFETREELKHVHLPLGSRRGVVFSNPGKYLALDCGDGTDGHEIQIYDTTTWDIVAILPSEIEGRSLSFSPNDITLAMIGPSEAILWNWRQRKIIHKWPIQVSGRGWDDTVAFLPDGRRLAIVGNSKLKIFDVANGDIEYKEPAPSEGVPLAISPDSRYVAMGSGYLTLMLHKY